ncbi:hypothetical protein FB45DRAFT_229560 [Roridomyces roridus]|uniref:Uncharacterized protein n=1 Tax=Roridomyces roridus TaxID=1738132 RepID=A0AAD7FCV2_9AGAR|nr:hypothetical protein FB45DRAFT_229560 [Roridomyces roridus]
MTSPVPSDIGRLTTPRLLGMFINSGLMGSLIIQVYYYFCTFPNDRSIAKATVYAVFCLELVQTGLMAYSAYCDFGLGDGNLVMYRKDLQSWMTPTILLITGLIIAIVQIFYAFRLYSFSGSRIACGTITWVWLFYNLPPLRRKVSYSHELAMETVPPTRQLHSFCGWWEALVVMSRLQEP